ncbi:hypothetical protein LCGC14_0955470 [marine sediment metagenome]|uniref:LysM domain-containing protein n=1 Tax=marine sediment metagenome TaxID=412755 RepID=A0A0F9P262_9ZZZZ
MRHFIICLMFLFGCVSQSNFDIKVNELETQLNAVKQYNIAQIDTLYGEVELNSFLIEAIYGQLIELKAELVAIQIKNNQVFYVVKRGDCLWYIAENELGDPFKWVQIADLNELEDPDLIFPNQILKIKE